MTKKNSTKRSLVLSALSLLLCFSMLVGTTFAWFTDEVSSKNNIIKSGNLDLTLEYWDGSSWKDVHNSSEILDENALWEPGYTEVVYLRLQNVGTLALKYQLGINIVDETAGVRVNEEGNDEDFLLSDYIYFDIVEGINGETGAYANREAAMKNATETTKISAGYSKADTLVAGSDPLYLAMIVYMPTSVGNEANHKTGAENTPEIALGINAFATQLAHEEDSFDKTYDDLASQSGSITDDAPAAGETKRYEIRNDLNSELIAAMTVPGDAVEDPTKGISISIIPDEKDETVVVDEAKQDVATFDITVTNLKENNVESILVDLFVGKGKEGVKLYHKSTLIEDAVYNAETGFVSFVTTSFSPYTVVYNKPIATVDGVAFNTLKQAFAGAENGDVIELASGYNTQDAQLTETIIIDKDVTLNPNGMYLVSNAPATFTVVEGGKLTVTEGSFTIKNTYPNGAAVIVDGGEFVMKGGSFDAHTAVRTTAGKSSTVTMTAGWSNRVTVAFDSNGNDTINILGGSIYSSAESIKTVAGNHLTLNMRGGLLSSKTTQYSAAVNLQCPATINMTGGKIENTYSSGYNGSSAIEANVAPTIINLSGSAALSSNGTAVMLGSHWSSPAVHEKRIILNMSGDSSISATSVMGFGIRYAQDNCDVTIAGNAKVNATYQAIQFNTNKYVYTNSTLTVAENATITSTAGRIGGGYAIASNGHVTITGGTISGSTVGVASFQAGAVVIIDNSTSGTPITINKVDIAEDVTYTVAGNPTIG